MTGASTRPIGESVNVGKLDRIDESAIGTSGGPGDNLAAGAIRRHPSQVANRHGRCPVHHNSSAGLRRTRIDVGNDASGLTTAIKSDE
jgi:hypothetical protein